MTSDHASSTHEASTDVSPVTALDQCETERCLACGRERVLRRIDNPISDRTYWIGVCTHCKHQTLLPLPSPDDLKAFYDNYGTTKTEADFLSFLIEKESQYFKSIVAEFGRTHSLRLGVEPSTYLEVGFGNGAGIIAAAQQGFSAFGVEMDPTQVTAVGQIASARGLRCTLNEGTVGHLPLDRTYDVARASQLIEHLRDPAGFLSDVRDRQPVGGLLLLQCPNNIAAFWKVKNLVRVRFNREDFYLSLKKFEHLQGFTARSMRLLLERQGYRVLRIRSYFLRDRYLMPENLIWYPSVLEGLARTATHRDPYHFLKALIPVFDKAAWLVGSATHLDVVAEKV